MFGCSVWALFIETVSVLQRTFCKYPGDFRQVNVTLQFLVVKELLQKKYKAIYFWNRVPIMFDKEWNGFGNETDTLVHEQY